MSIFMRSFIYLPPGSSVSERSLCKMRAARAPPPERASRDAPIAFANAKSPGVDRPHLRLHPDFAARRLHSPLERIEVARIDDRRAGVPMIDRFARAIFFVPALWHFCALTSSAQTLDDASLASTPAVSAAGHFDQGIRNRNEFGMPRDPQDLGSLWNLPGAGAADADPVLSSLATIAPTGIVPPFGSRVGDADDGASLAGGSNYWIAGTIPIPGLAVASFVCLAAVLHGLASLLLYAERRRRPTLGAGSVEE
jgi:hypothetical protein